jgi:hypothetical protein
LSSRNLALIALLSATVSGCGYALAGHGSFLPTYIKTVAIPPLENRSTFYQIDQVLTEKIRGEFIGRGKYAVVTDRSAADAVMVGEISTVSAQPVGFTEQQLASRYLFTLQMKVQFIDTRTSEVLWSNDAFVFRSEYELNTRGVTAIEGASFFDQERSSVDRISTDIARTVVTAILEAF